MIAVKELAWLGGLLEGEGSFGIKNGSPRIQLAMTDKDVVDRAAKIFGVPVEHSVPRKDGYKQVWRVCLNGTRAIMWMMTLLVLFGERRREKITEVIETWKASKAAPRAPRGQRYMAVCHPDRPRQGDLLCNTCWMRRWRAETGRNGTYYRNQAKQKMACT